MNKNCVVVISNNLEHRIDKSKLVNMGTYPYECYTIRKRARDAGLNSLKMSAVRNGYHILELRDEKIGCNGRKYSVRPTFYRIINNP